MENLGARSTLLVAATLVAALLPMGAEAVAPAAAPGRTVTVQTSCSPSGKVDLTQTARAGSTHVEIDVRNVRNGRWRGEYLLEVGVDDTVDTRIDVRVSTGDFHVEIDVPDTGKAGIVDLRRVGDPARHCFVSFDEDAPATMMGSHGISAIVRHPEPRRVIARAELDCRTGTRWQVTLGVMFDNGYGAGGGDGDLPCRHGSITIKWRRDQFSPPTAGSPIEMDFYAVRQDGKRTRRLIYEATSPAS